MNPKGLSQNTFFVLRGFISFIPSWNSYWVTIDESIFNFQAFLNERVPVLFDVHSRVKECGRLREIKNKVFFSIRTRPFNLSEYTRNIWYLAKKKRTRRVLKQGDHWQMAIGAENVDSSCGLNFRLREVLRRATKLSAIVTGGSNHQN